MEAFAQGESVSKSMIKWTNPGNPFLTSHPIYPKI